ncbi:hypothetical protein [Mycoplasmopsis felis]|uniref:Uncharacterized protein n=1 Tax=Mycoplasmopsis felis TaxID=33923 RepID=A0A809SF38_9BACT|nr:hypothetical protein [Mycoplasmopsis felis]BBU47898.1 hypothetical protein JPM2_5910 [Mycoplasmopsis felis]
MALPNTFNRYSVQSKINPNYKLIYTENWPKNSFIVNDREYSVNCVFKYGPIKVSKHGIQIKD